MIWSSKWVSGWASDSEGDWVIKWFSEWMRVNEGVNHCFWKKTTNKRLFFFNYSSLSVKITQTSFLDKMQKQTSCYFSWSSLFYCYNVLMQRYLESWYILSRFNGFFGKGWGRCVLNPNIPLLVYDLENISWMCLVSMKPKLTNLISRIWNFGWNEKLAL